MPDAYTLLPSSGYFSKVADPVVDFTNAPTLKAVVGSQVTQISNLTNLSKFMLGANGRTKPLATDVETPNVLNPTLHVSSVALHNILDSWTPATSTSVVQIAGWGIDTAKTLKYFERDQYACPLSLSCRVMKSFGHTTENTIDGDGTVVLPSQLLGTSTDSYYIDLLAYNYSTKGNRKHLDVTESKPFQELFTRTIASSSIAPLPQFVSKQKPAADPNNSRNLKLRVLSPVTLDAYDSEGRHTGRIPAANPDLFLTEELIPNSSYTEYGEGKYLNISGDSPVTIKMKGTDTGTFTFESTDSNSGTTTVTSFKDILVTASTTAEIRFMTAVQKPDLLLDTNGDGFFESVVSSSAASETPLQYFALLQSTLPHIEMGDQTRRQLNAKLKNIQHLLLKNSQWEIDDDDGDKNDSRKSERVEARTLRKIDKVSAWINAEKLRSDGWISNRKKPRVNPNNLPAVSAEGLLTSIQRLHALIK
jgi:hypothetical protein